MPTEIEEYYVIRVKRKANLTNKPATPLREVFISSTDKLGSIGKAKKFSCIEDAEVYAGQRHDHEHYQFQIQYCTLFKPPMADDPITTITDELMQIPYPYRRTAYNWYRGRDVEALLKRESDEVYQRHHRLLLDYNIDITSKSNVVLLGPTRKHKKSVTQQQDTSTSPRQYFAYPHQRPKLPAGHVHPSEKFNHSTADSDKPETQ